MHTLKPRALACTGLRMNVRASPIGSKSLGHAPVFAPVALTAGPADAYETTQALGQCVIWGVVNGIGHSFKRTAPCPAFRIETRAVAGEAIAPAFGLPTLRERLSFRPILSWFQVLACLLASSSVCAAVYALTAPDVISMWYAGKMAALCVLLLTATRHYFLEQQWAGQLCDVTELGNADSHFRTIGNMNVHYTLNRPLSAGPQDRRLAAHCYHGFGANTASWAYLRQPLANALSAAVTAHDMPGFGLTQRPKDNSKFTLGFNGRMGRVLMDCELAAGGLIPPFDASTAAKAPTFESSLMFPHRLRQEEDWGEDDDGSMEEGVAAQTDRVAAPVGRVLIGHSMGCVCATADAIKHPQGIEALVLISPALVALPMEPKAQAPGKPGHVVPSGHSKAAAFAHGHLAHQMGPPPRPRWVQRIVGLLRALVWPIAFLWVRLMILLARPALVLLLRLVVRSPTFWLKGLTSSWYKSENLPEELVDAYRAPQLVRGWEDGLLRFLLARVSGRGVIATLQETFLMHEVRQPATSHVRQLAGLAAAHRLKVLIIHGEKDVLLPVRNSRGLAALIPHAQLVVVPDCGHCPQEERPHETVAAIQSFLQASSG